MRLPGAASKNREAAWLKAMENILIMADLPEDGFAFPMVTTPIDVCRCVEQVPVMSINLGKSDIETVAVKAKCCTSRTEWVQRRECHGPYFQDFKHKQAPQQ